MQNNIRGGDKSSFFDQPALYFGRRNLLNPENWKRSLTELPFHRIFWEDGSILIYLYKNQSDMKRSFTILALLSMFCPAWTQVRPVAPDNRSNLRVPARTVRIGGEIPFTVAPNVTVSGKAAMDDPAIMMTNYDMMTNSSVQNRLYIYPDGTMGGITTMSHDNSGAFQDRGTGYNYFDGSVWGPQPATRLENLRTGWPSYAPWNNGGEIVVSHHFATFPPIMMTRPVRGSGNWTQTEIAIPQDAAGIDWPRMVTNGPGNLYVHVIGLTTPVASGGSLYLGLDGALLYNRSLDGGNTWSGWQLLDGMTSADYLGFGGDAYAFAEPRGDTLCFVVGDSWNDAFIMKSTDNGTTWTKTIIWNCPFNLWNGGDTTGTFNSPDGSNAVALDEHGVAHVMFGFMRVNGDEAGNTYWFPWTDGLIYWNENMPELPQDLDPDALLASGNYIGWVQDTMVWYQDETSLAYYYLSMSSMPTLVIDDDRDRIYAVWASQTTYLDANGVMYRHLFSRTGYNLGASWGEFMDLTDDFVYQFQECVYPFMAPKIMEDKFYILFEADDEAGVYINGSQGAQGQSAVTDNNLIVLTHPVITSLPEAPAKPALYASPAFPNPTDKECFVDIRIGASLPVVTEIISPSGITLRTLNSGLLTAGNHRLSIRVEGLSPGIYFTRITAGESAVTGKVVIR